MLFENIILLIDGILYYAPTAVNLDRTCIIMIESMIRAIMCINPVAPWKMIVFASSTVRE